MYGCHSGKLDFNNTIENVRSIPDIDARITGASASEAVTLSPAVLSH